MSRYVDLGIYAESGKTFRGDLDIILRSNVLLQANSGGGKSWALRRFIEQAFKRVPQIIIDPEGEFSTLRSHFDVVLVGKGGDTPADIRSAKLLAHRLLELGTSAVIDLYEMSKPQRPVWVAAFLSALIDAPKKLWRDFLIYIDEAHEFAPEPGHGTESRDEKVCRHALIDLAAKGRKRGYGVIAATQRLGKLSKDFAAELKNVLIGQTFIDIDRERAAGSLGVVKGNKLEFFASVMKLEPGAFFAFGRAFILEPTLVTIGDVVTEHPEAGRRQSAPPPPTDKIRHLLPQLADLPKEAEDKLQTEKELRGRIVELEREVARAPAAVVAASVGKTKTVEVKVPVLGERDRKKIERLTMSVSSLTTQLDRNQRVESGVRAEMDSLVKALAEVVKPAAFSDGSLARGIADAKAGRVSPVPVHVFERPRQVRAVEREAAADTSDSTPNGHMPEKCQKMLGALIQGEAMGLPSMPFRNVAVIAGVAPDSGTTGNRKGFLKNNGYITVQGDHVRLTEKGRQYPINVEMPPTDRLELLEFWKRVIKTGKIAAMLDFVVRNNGATDDELAAAAPMAKSGTFGNYKGALIGRGLMVKVSNGVYAPAEAFGR